MDTVLLGARRVKRLGLSAAGLRVTGMWGEPAGRKAAVAAIRRAVEMGVEVLEVPVPFGPAADLVREADVPGAFIVARLTGGPPDLAAISYRLGGRPPDLLLAGEGQLDGLRHLGVPVGVVLGEPAGHPSSLPLAAVRGPYPPPPGLLEWCEREGVPYMAASTAVLAAGRLTVALLAPRSGAEVERLLSEEGWPTPPAAGPG